MTLVVGIGARRGVTEAQVRAAVDHVLALAGARVADLGGGIDPGAGAVIFASVDAKAAEPGILTAIGPAPLHARPAAALAAVPVAGSARVAEAVGTPSVAEAAALLVARERDPAARLLVPRTVVGPVTVAAATCDDAGSTGTPVVMLDVPPEGAPPP